MRLSNGKIRKCSRLLRTKGGQGRKIENIVGYRLKVQGENGRDQNSLNKLEELWDNDKKNMTTDQKVERLKLQRIIAAREGRLQRKEEEVFYTHLLEWFMDELELKSN